MFSTVSTAIGLLWSSTTLYEGPLMSFTDGVDLSFISAFIIGGLLYYVTGKLESAQKRMPHLSRTCSRSATGASA